MHTVQAHGAAIPALGFGTWQLRGDAATDLVRVALETGYRHIDTARMYGNEAEVGRAIKASGVARDQIFLTTKVWPDDFTRDALDRAVADSLKSLGTDYVDLLLLHWPNPAVPLRETLGGLAHAHRQGRARHVGVSNFTVALIEEAVSVSEVPLCANQVEYHPYLSQEPVLASLRRHGMALTAHSPMARGNAASDPTLRRIGETHGKSPVQVCLRWLVQQEDVAAIPRTQTAERVRSNFAVFDFELTREEMAEITGLARPDGRLVNPAIAPAWDAA
ncbi:aldo/keto reductase [Marinivivus vitaminiproducens]|uniref:aldo/keto reductase n=1 Tax=Marinivivus vitaminiproducens TaxID=3035935 RepID=UPI0027A9B444|nr:aldo/keto reductase [Geminicoccaceae bacterium SCSIO 64248]